MMTPETEEQLAGILAGAERPVSVRGGATRGVLGDGDALSTSGLSGVRLYEPGALTIVVGAGTPVDEINSVLAGENQRLAFEPMDHRGLLGTSGVPTIGGVFAGNVSGPRRIQVGAARDFALGVRFVDGSGTILKNGGRVMKNVTGYDLVKLMCGSWGTLGVLSEVSLKVLPMPEAEATLQIGGLDVAGAVSLLARALGSPYDVSGAAFDPALGCAYVRVEGFAPSVRYRSEELRDLLKSDVDVIEGAASAKLWRGVRDVVPLHDVTGDIWRVSVKPSDAPVVIAQAQAAGALLDWAGGLIWLALPAGTDLRARLQGLAGHATLVRAAPDTLAQFGKFEPEAPGLAALSAGLRAKFDPRGILNPNLMTRTAAA